MSDDIVDEELLALLRKSLGISETNAPQPATTGVLEDAEYIYDCSTDVAVDMRGTKAAATTIWSLIQAKGYSAKDWSKHELHPKAKDESTVDFIFLMDLLNFSFWSDMDDPDQQFAVEYKGQKWIGYWSLVAAIQRGLDEGVQITDPCFWIDDTECTDNVLKHVFRSATKDEMPLTEKRIECIRETGHVLQEVGLRTNISHWFANPPQRFDGSFLTCIKEANHSAAALVNLLVRNFPCFDDTHYFEGAKVRFHKRAQILVADLWACFEGESYGYFHDIDQLTMFAGKSSNFVPALAPLQQAAY